MQILTPKKSEALKFMLEQAIGVANSVLLLEHAGSNTEIKHELNNLRHSLAGMVAAIALADFVNLVNVGIVTDDTANEPNIEELSIAKLIQLRPQLKHILIGELLAKLSSCDSEEAA